MESATQAYLPLSCAEDSSSPSCTQYKLHGEALELPEDLQFDDCGGPSTDPAKAAAETTVDVLSDGGPDELTCAICLEQILPAEIAVVKGCEHSYCAKCILRWTMLHERARCPKCKTVFSHLFTYRHLDGTLHDFPMEESVTLLKRARWLQDYLKELDKGKGVAEAPVIDEHDWSYDYDRYYDEYDDDEEVEAYYFSAAAGRARITLGNRRWGENGYVAAGRQQARPVRPAGKQKGKGKAGAEADSSTPARGGASGAAPSTPFSGGPGRSGGKKGSGKKGARTAAAQSTPISIANKHQPQQVGAADGMHCTTPVSGASPSAAYGSWSEGAAGSGRRARRNARRAVLDGDAMGASPC